MKWIKYSKGQPTPKTDGEYLCRFWCDEFHAVRGSQYLPFTKGAFQVEHYDYFSIEWLDESESPAPEPVGKGEGAEISQFADFVAEWLSNEGVDPHATGASVVAAWKAYGKSPSGQEPGDRKWGDEHLKRAFDAGDISAQADAEYWETGQDGPGMTFEQWLELFKASIK